MCFVVKDLKPNGGERINDFTLTMDIKVDGIPEDGYAHPFSLELSIGSEPFSQVSRSLRTHLEDFGSPLFGFMRFFF